VLAEACPVPTRRVGVADVFGTSGEPDELMAHFGLTAEDIVSAAKELL
jgi:transketolase